MKRTMSKNENKQQMKQRPGIHEFVYKTGVGSAPAGQASSALKL